jgi:hypothetical protein
MELYPGEAFNRTRIDCYKFIEPCLDYGAKKRYPFLAVYAPIRSTSPVAGRSPNFPFFTQQLSRFGEEGNWSVLEFMK